LRYPEGGTLHKSFLLTAKATANLHEYPVLSSAIVKKVPADARLQPVVRPSRQGNTGEMQYKKERNPAIIR